MRDGRYLVCGGEYQNQSPLLKHECEVFDPLSNAWFTVQDMPAIVIDTPASVLPGGGVLINGYGSSTATWQFNPEDLTWDALANHSVSKVNSEGGAVLLQDGSVLEGYSSYVRYLPGLDQWVDTAPSPNGKNEFLAPSNGTEAREIGPSIVLQDGRVLVLGGASVNGLYTPPPLAAPLTPSTDAGSWEAVDATPNGLNHGDSPSSIEPTTGNVFTVASSDPFGFGTGSVSLLEFQPSAPAGEQWLTIPSPGVTLNVAPNRARLLVLPTGQILVAARKNTLLLYRPGDGSVADDTWRPKISSVSPPVFGQYRVDGTQLNGLSVGADYGDDAKLGTHYPIALLAPSGAPGQSYLYSNRFDQMAPRPSTPGHFFFTGAPLAGNYNLFVTADGLRSLDSVPISFPIVDQGPALVAAAL